MSFWVLIQVLVNIVLLAGIGILWIKTHRPQKDDPRLSRGLQLLQSKISVLEDLSDRTENQSAQLMALMDAKAKEFQAQVAQADREIHRIEASMEKSKEVALIFQDKIPHQEIIQRQNTVKYVKAARLAHQGFTVDEIASQVDLPRGELEIIAKVNRQTLQFSEEDLPAWALGKGASEILESAPNPFGNLIEPMGNRPMQMSIPITATGNPMQDLGSRFREALQQEQIQETVQKTLPQTAVPQSFIEPQVKTPQKPTNLRPPDNSAIRKVVFPRIDLNKSLS